MTHLKKRVVLDIVFFMKVETRHENYAILFHLSSMTLSVILCLSYFLSLS